MSDDEQEEAKPQRCIVVYEDARVTHIRVSGRAGKNQPHTKDATVRVGKQGRYACLTCHTADQCFHSREARKFMAMQSAEPSALPTVPIPSEGYRR